MGFGVGHALPDAEEKSLGIVLLYGPTGWRFLMSKVTLYG